VFNPYVLLGALIFLAVACAGSYLKGYKNAENAAKAAYADSLSDAIANARETARIDTEAAVKLAEARQKVRVEFKERVVTVEKLINANPSPRECRIPDAAVGLINELINGANSEKKSGSAVESKKPVLQTIHLGVDSSTSPF
jgi:hypothetical protein